VRDLIPALVARRFYLEGRTKKEIGDELGISRFKVARILDQALRDGVVRIEVSEPPEVDFELSARVAERFGLRQVLVLRADQAAGTTSTRQLGRACVQLLAERLSEDDVLGVSWGRTLHTLTEAMPRLPPATLVQIVGSVPSADLNVNSLELLRRLGESTRGPVLALHVPMVLESAPVAASLRADEHVAATLAAFGRLSCALVGVGAWRPGGSSLRSALPGGLVRELDEAGAVADVCSTVINSDGAVVGGDAVPSRCIAITTDELRSVPDVIGVAGGAEKVTAIAAAVRAGLLHRLITDATAATGLLRS
jgi:DNA-binding transcriptional regulator LsrR (DeoR family)